MSTSRYIEINCDSQRPNCDDMVGPERTVRDVLRVAKAQGWIVRDPTVGDQCPSCQAAEQDERGGHR